MKTMAMTAPLTAATRRGNKTQTRREIVKFFNNQKKKCPPPDDSYAFMGIQGFNSPCALWYSEKHKDSIWAKLSYKTGDIVAIREPAVIESYSIDAASGKCTIKYLYKADEDYERRTPHAMELPERFFDEVSGAPTDWVQKHMGGIPNGCIREMLRTFIRIVDVRIERLNEISNDDAKAEGITPMSDPVLEGVFYPRYGLKSLFPYYYEHEAVKSFKSLWESIDGKGTFGDQYIFVYVYKLIDKEDLCHDVA